MSGLTSGIVFHDPEPWAYSRNSQTGPGPFGLPDRSAQRFDGMMMHYPRPEYDHHNPILQEVRALSRYNETGKVVRHMLWRLVGTEYYDGEYPDNPEVITHAVRVLRHWKGVYGS